MEKRFILLSNELSGLKFGLHLERSEFGIVGILNFHFSPECEYELLLTDEAGENYYAKADSNPFSFFLPRGFSLSGSILVDIFSEGGLVASGVMGSGDNKANSNFNKFIKSTNDYVVNYETDEEFENLKQEANYFINKAKELYNQNEQTLPENNKPEQKSPKNAKKTTFFDKIKEDFNFLYSVGEEDYLLTRKFKNSVWRKVVIGEEVYILGKIYAGRVIDSGETPSFVAIAVPTTLEGANLNNPLGSQAKFYHANIYDSFGFSILIENAESGKVASI